MKRIFYISLLCIAVASFGCDNQPVPDTGFNKPLYIGKHIDESGAIDCSELKDKLGSASEIQTKVKGEVIGICPDKTCELKMDMEDGTCMVVKMNNINVSIPKDATGKTAIIEGKAYIDTTSEKVLPGYGGDSGRSATEGEPDVTLAFNAVGVIIK